MYVLETPKFLLYSFNKIIFDFDELKKIMKFLISYKYMNKKDIPDNEFLNKYKKIIYPEIHLK